MANSVLQTKLSGFAKHWSLCAAAVISTILIYFTISKYQRPVFSTLMSEANTTDHCPQICHTLLTRTQEHEENKINSGTQYAQALPNRRQDPRDKTFYDDRGTQYTVDKPMIDWDAKRKEWLKHHSTFSMENRVLVLTGSQPWPCEYRTGDHLMLRLFKNKVDYCRIHGYDIFYNNAFLDPQMRSFWAKIPLVRAAMLAHPDKEWIFWVDSDAMFTDMEFRLPLEKFKDYNLVVHGWLSSIYEAQSWYALNAGVFLIRNCQWSMDLLDVWASMGPKSPDYAKWGEIQRSTFKNKMLPDSDDQSALIYLLLKEKEKWGTKTYVQDQYALSSYWVDIVGKFENITKKYKEMEYGSTRFRRRHAEAVSESYAADGEELQQLGEWRRPFITHFVGCRPCNGDLNPAYAGDSCWVGIERALNFADNQVLRNYGFVHPNIGDGSSVTPVRFDYP